MSIVVHRKMVSGMTLELEQLRAGREGKGNLILELLVLALLLVAIGIVNCIIS